ncbi:MULTISPECIES: hypothetical protein [unclassified Spirosoma]|uniref:hypothetical protein n=1 Tax=unclassified Spirosoma TaxID=2621999 RepID=UPI0009617E79|nr:MULTISPECIES: hypothetical protein [unclassified Spirosoma]MBN8824099.1 hypothetical protein [Spirosoma sp.]OJW70496.1 MAG: hypothetical protein BGO59_24940 [Spirosoma sp. 48-14]
MAILISVLALLATFYQLHLQRVHNEKSLKPLGQIDLPDYNKQLAVHVRNNGLGPLIIDRLTFIKDGQSYTIIDDCLDLNPRSYMRMAINNTVKRVVLPAAYLVVFETQFGEHEGEGEINHARQQLAAITLKVEGRDIYDNKIRLERNFNWFSRYMLDG